MRFRKHSRLEGQHAFLSPSSYHWINYDEEKLAFRYRALRAALEGMEQHRFAAVAIEEKSVQDDESNTVGLYINQSIQFYLVPEVVLYYSPNAFGTADAIAWRHKRLRISDLKTGVTRVSFHQLEVYAALFFLEYKISPFSARAIELRMYKDNGCDLYEAFPEDIQAIMDKIVRFDIIIDELRKEESRSEA